MLEILHYQQHGRTHQSAPVLVLIHGLFGSADNLSVIRRHFEADYRIINFDLPDHGLSPWSQKFSFEDYAKQIILTLQSLNISSASLLAHSLGGKVAMWVSFLHPQLVKHLICLDIAPAAYEARHQSVLSGLTSINLAQLSSRRDAQQSLAKFIPDAGTQAFLLKSLYQEGESWKWRFNLDLLVRDYPILSQWSLAKELVFAGDVLFIKGNKSDYITKSHQASILKQFPNAKAKIVDAGHWLHAEKPQVVNTLITKHLLGN